MPSRAMKIPKSLLSFFISGFLILNLATYGFAEKKSVSSGIPQELSGFRGMMNGKLIQKKELSFSFRVDRIMKTWKANKAENPKKAVGKTVVLNLEKLSQRHRAEIMKNFELMKNGDQIEVEAFDLGANTLSVKEWLKKAGQKK